jgi:hypothetical protein
MRRRRRTDRRARLPQDAAGGVVRVVLPVSGWALVVPPPGTSLEPGEARRLVQSLLVCVPHGLAGPAGSSLVRVPDSMIDRRLGPAVLHCTLEQTVTYCAASQVTARAAAALSALAGRAALIAPGPAGDRPPPVMEVKRVSHSLLPAGLHPAVAVQHAGQHMAFAVCAELITSTMAAVLGALGSACMAGRESELPLPWRGGAHAPRLPDRSGP